METNNVPTLKVVYCYAHEDQLLRDDLESHLAGLRRANIITTWHDGKIIPGVPREESIYNNLSTANIILLLVSSDFLNSDHSYSKEMNYAIERHQAGTAHVIPILLRPVVWAGTPFAHLQILPANGVPVTVWQNRDEAFANVVRGIRLAIRAHYQGASVLFDDSQALSEEEQPLSVERPYCGLDAFTEQQARYFFGREKDIERLLERLRHDMRFLAVLGPSGSGKSSTVQAGLLPRLRQGAIRDSKLWGTITIRPADDPFKGLITQRLADKSRQLKDGVKNWLAGHSQQTRLLLVIDQFEELLVACTESIRQDFIAQLLQLLNSNLPITVLIIMRDDFYGQIVEYEVLAKDWLEQRLVNISKTLQPAEVAAIIQKPAELVGLSFEEGLVEIIVENTLENRPDRTGEGRIARSTILPLLEFTLTELWKRSQQGVLTREAYEAIGGVTGGLTQWADQVFFGLADEEKQQEARRVFTRLVYPGDEQQQRPDSKRRLPLSALNGPNRSAETTYQVIQQLVASKLLIIDYDRQSHQEMVEIIHDALLWEWGEMRRWLERDHEFIVWQRELDRQAGVWMETDILSPTRRDQHKLLKDSDLQEALTWWAERADDFSQTEQDFFLASRHFWQMRRRLSIIASSLVGLGLLAAGSIWGAVSFIPRYINIFLYTKHSSPVWSMAWSPFGDRIASAPGGGRDFEVHVWSATSASSVYRYSAHTRSVKSVSWSPDGYRVATGSYDKTVQVWSSDGLIHQPTTSSPYTYNNHTDFVLAVAWSPDGQYIASGAAANDKTVQVWRADVERIGEVVFKYSGHNQPINSIAWSPNSQYIASGSGDNTVQLWEAVTGKIQLIYKHHTDHVLSVAWSPNNQYIASAGIDKTVQVWSATTGTRILTYSGHNQTIDAVTWSPDSKYIASASFDQTVQVWEALTGNWICTYDEHHNIVRSVGWSPSSTQQRMLASAGDDKQVHIWKLK